jgi:hypothetical protein
LCFATDAGDVRLQGQLALRSHYIRLLSTLSLAGDWDVASETTT